MIKTWSVAALALLSALPAHALDAHIVRQLDALAPDERREQRCDIEAMDRIKKDNKGEFKPDKVIAYTFSQPVEDGNAIRAPGAVFRSAGDWYRLKYKCETGDKGLEVMSFDYKIGSKVPREEWEKYYLYE
ncbi:Hypothetical protein RG1141_CH07740 [Neorhizobium galegae bv. officinalis bv. officinalis str. HAMBI 1141]|jgi:hypothetical protein|uniref:DUF930 domain-containing protein n=1 Tax=Neorhizobium galegae bv. officinalis bv. officinalis str. HAMBI 1141 TaxID=1028801 RepID=A0A068T4W1_NEOGA|nr:MULTISPECIES: DUF930 domain-containing protein [Neorhizobium]MCJ9673037.1 DUF930 domain-containing protein [Neorhizobium sp. SHOUNA12B]MCJ9748423.1 DUF930 domain-containing protein [Neorhizobium sp. SHOUNA12A]CDN53134.1 Hypothetical protein RG1141_CH07740 [Neorhizobium galegae bv. officinalis bv. officinalis str. HAMBI 1141]